MNRLLIVDGHAYAYRAFYAIRSLRSPTGRPTNAIFGFIKMLAKLRAGLDWPSSPNPPSPGGAEVRGTVGRVEPKPGCGTRATGETTDPVDRAGNVYAVGGRGRNWGKPSHVLVVWDGGLSAARLAAWPAYKAQRPEMPGDLAEQLDGIERYLAAAGVASFCGAGIEADDYIGWLARAAGRAGWGVVIASADKDFMQLVSGDEGRGAGRVETMPGSGAMATGATTDPVGSAGKVYAARGEGQVGRIGLLNPNDKSEGIWGAAQVRAKAGVEPEQIVDWLSLVGDGVDNIPGVPGVGPKTAAGLLGQFGSVAGLYGRLAEVKSARIRAALLGAEADVRRNLELVRLPDVVGFDFSPAALAEQPADVARLAELFELWGFRSLRAELGDVAFGNVECGSPPSALGSAPADAVDGPGTARQENLL